MRNSQIYSHVCLGFKYISIGLINFASTLKSGIVMRFYFCQISSSSLKDVEFVLRLFVCSLFISFYFLSICILFRSWKLSRRVWLVGILSTCVISCLTIRNYSSRHIASDFLNFFHPSFANFIPQSLKHSFI